MGRNVRGPLLTGDEICKIIEACAKNSVHEFTFDNLRIVFGSKPIESENSNDEQPKLIIEDERSPSEERKESLSQLEDEINESLLTDPVAFEDAMTSQEFLDEADQNGRRPT